jgi:hypothetical protein
MSAGIVMQKLEVLDSCAWAAAFVGLKSFSEQHLCRTLLLTVLPFGTRIGITGSFYQKNDIQNFFNSALVLGNTWTICILVAQILLVNFPFGSKQ